MAGPRAYYSDNDPFACAWMRELIKEGLIADGDVDERSILDVKPGDLTGYTQCHFFAGIAGWSLALRMAGVPDDYPVWSGSAPCQPFSAAGKQEGVKDERHLWPAFYDLITACQPAVVIGEQVSGKLIIGERSAPKKTRKEPDSTTQPPWFDSLASDLEAASYSVGAASLSASAVGAPHIRQRLYWVGIRESSLDHTDSAGWKSGEYAAAPARHGSSAEPTSNLCSLADTLHAGRPERGASAGDRPITRSGSFGELANTASEGPMPWRRGPEQSVGSKETWEQFRRSCDASELGDSRSARSGRDGRTVLGAQGEGTGERGAIRRVTDEPIIASHLSFWDYCEWIPCIDGKYRAIEARAAQPRFFEMADGLPESLGRSGGEDEAAEGEEKTYDTFPVVHNYPNRIGALKGYGNAICPPLAAAFIKAVLQ